LRTISDEIRPETITYVRERSILLRSAYPMTRSRALCLPMSSETARTFSRSSSATIWIPPVVMWSSEFKTALTEVQMFAVLIV